MIYLYTGLNGAGKTSSSLYDILEVVKKTGRPFFASGINWTDLGKSKFNPTIIEPAEWRDCPEGSIILVDEAQNSMPARPNSKDLPDWINALGTHRHKGHDIYLTTPHPMQIDVFARRLVGIHRHYIRAFSFGSTTRLENEGAMSDPTSKLDTHKAIVTRHKLRKSVYPYYISTALDTHKARIPVRKLLYGVGILAFLGGSVVLGLRTWHNMTGQHPIPGMPRSASVSPSSTASPAVATSVSSSHVSHTSALTVVGSLSMGGHKVYLVADSHGNLHQASNCRVINDAPTCALGESVVTWPDVSPAASVPALH